MVALSIFGGLEMKKKENAAPRSEWILIRVCPLLVGVETGGNTPGQDVLYLEPGSTFIGFPSA